MPIMERLRVDASEAGERLDVFLTRKKPALSRAAIQKRIKTGAVAVNGKPASAHQFLKAGDEVDCGLTPQEPSHDIESHSDAERIPLHDPRIIDESSSWIVLDKPAGLLVHPTGQSGTESSATLVDWLVAHHPPIAKVGEDPNRPGIVHRLDREVSGLMVAAKTQRAYDDLQRQFAERRVKKNYLALVHGEMPKEEGDIKFRIARSSSKARMAARPAHEEAGKAAWTHYRVKQKFIGATLVDLEILSGRTHQIRAHLHALGHPVMGDPLYRIRRTDRTLQAPRLMLQSVGLAFADPATGEQKTFSLPPDPAFGACIERLR